MSKTEGKLVVKYVVNISGKRYLPGTYNVKGGEYTNLSKAPYVREATEQELAIHAEFKKKQTAARVAKGIVDEKKAEPNPANNTVNPNLIADVIATIEKVTTIEALNEFNYDTPELKEAIDKKRTELEASINEAGKSDVTEVTTFTEEDLRALPEADLRALYIAEQAKIGKTVPANIGVITIITNLTK